MNSHILNHYLQFGIYTYPGLYQERLKKDLPDNIREIGLLIRKNLIHRSTLKQGNRGTNADLRFGDMTQVPWWRQPEDDVFPTASAMLAELYRRNERGFVMDRKQEDKLILTCRFVSILFASILKSKGIPVRVRSGNASYFDMRELGFNGGEFGKISTDHWINQYWDAKNKRWVTVDVDGSLSLNEPFDPYDMPDGKFDFPADAWLQLRAGKIDPFYFYNAGFMRGAIVVLYSLFYDFHSLMNHEIIYFHTCGYAGHQKFTSLTEAELKKIDHLATLMQKPDDHFDQLTEIYNADKDFRMLIGGLL